MLPFMLLQVARSCVRGAADRQEWIHLRGMFVPERPFILSLSWQIWADCICLGKEEKKRGRFVCVVLASKTDLFLAAGWRGGARQTPFSSLFVLLLKTIDSLPRQARDTRKDSAFCL